jgi:hypothetical protein
MVEHHHLSADFCEYRRDSESRFELQQILMIMPAIGPIVAGGGLHWVGLLHRLHQKSGANSLAPNVPRVVSFWPNLACESSEY